MLLDIEKLSRIFEAFSKPENLAILEALEADPGGLTDLEIEAGTASVTEEETEKRKGLARLYGFLAERETLRILDAVLESAGGLTAGEISAALGLGPDSLAPRLAGLCGYSLLEEVAGQYTQTEHLSGFIESAMDMANQIRGRSESESNDA